MSLWEAAIEPPARSFGCSIACRLDDGTAVYLAPTGVASGIERLDRFPVVVGEVPLPRSRRPGRPVPSSTRCSPIGSPTATRATTPHDVAPWGVDTDTGPVSMGGDLAGIAARADYLADLGVDVVYLTPVFTSPSNHRYDTVDYRSVDPDARRRRGARGDGGGAALPLGSG